MIARRTLVTLTAATVAGATLVGAVGGPVAALDEVDTDLVGTSIGANQFGIDLYAGLVANNPDANLVISPLSVEVALAMASSGAHGDTAAEIYQALGLDTMADPNLSVRGLLAALDESAGDAVSVANSLWTQDGFEIAPEFSQFLTDFFNADTGTVDFQGDPEGALEAVNGWVAERTNGRIPALLGPNNINDLTRLILLNAVYLDAEWESPFEPDATYDQAFVALDGEVMVPFMHQTLDGASYAEGADGTQALTLPYTTGLEMVVVLPAGDGLDGLAAFEESLVEANGDLFALVGAGAWAPEVVVALPTWESETRESLADVLQALGIETAFGDGADFTGINPDAELRVSDVVHQANITVDEAGTEASAATAIAMEAGSAMPVDEPEPVYFVADQPFYYLVRDTATGTVIFQGRVTDPSAG